MASAQFSTDISKAVMPRPPEPPWKTATSDAELLPWAQRARRLNAVLEAKGMSSRELSLQVSKSDAHVAHVLSGRIKSPRADFWNKVAELTGTSVSYLLNGELPMFRQLGPEGNRYPSREGILDAAKHLPSSVSMRVRTDLIADSDHATDPGPACWAAQLSALIARYSKLSG